MSPAAFPEVPGHTLLSELGRGGMARVYLAREEQLHRLVALKVIAERFDGADDFRRRFEREARTAAGLTHANIVPVYAYGVTASGSPYLSMAFLDGGTLRERLRKHGPMRVEDALAVARQVASALRAAHERNVVHRDLKPDNVMFQGDNALLTDFGIAKVLDASTGLTGTGVNPGTVSYFSPEQAAGEAVDQRSDIYTLGVVLYEMLTGHLPIEARTYPAFIHRILSVAPSPLPAALAGLQSFMDLLLAKDPADRPNSCAEVIAIIDAMNDNRVRHRSVDRLADGIVMARSGRRAAERDLDAVEARADGRARDVDPEAPTAPLTPVDSDPTFALGDEQTPSPVIPSTGAMRARGGARTAAGMPVPEPPSPATRTHVAALPDAHTQADGTPRWRPLPGIALVLSMAIAVGVFALRDRAPRQVAEAGSAPTAMATMPAARAQPAPGLAVPLAPAMVTIDPGCFVMGSTAGRQDEQPVREVCIRQAFRIGAHEVTFDEYERFVAATGAERPSDEGWGRGQRPVINVSWSDANAYATWLSRQTGRRFRLPTEAEWEYAAGAGTRTRYWWGDTPSHDHANFGADACCAGATAGRDVWMHTSPVGALGANPLGLHDVLGNVWEWVQDCYVPDYAGAPVDGTARDGADCPMRVVRGGSWLFGPDGLRTTHRYWLTPGIRDFGYGFRLAEALPPASGDDARRRTP